MEVRNVFLSNFVNIINDFPEKAALYYCTDLSTKRTFITYSELDRLSTRLSVFLSKFITSKNVYIGVSLTNHNNNLWLPCLLMAIWKDGNSFAGLNNHYSLDHKLKFLDHCNIKYIITDLKENNYNAEPVCNFTINQKKFFLWCRKTEKESSSARNNVWDMCYAITTSGSTGLPKFIQVPWSCIMPNVEELKNIFEITSADNVFQSSPYTFDPYFVEIFLALTTGASLVMVSNRVKLSPYQLINILFQDDKTSKRQNEDQPNPKVSSTFSFKCTENEIDTLPLITVMQITPSIFNKWNNKYIKMIFSSKLRILVLGGEKFPTNVIQFKSQESSVRLFNIYGITEISCWAFINEIKNDSLVSLGKPLNGIEYKIDETNQLYLGSKSRKCLVDNETDIDNNEVTYRATGDEVEIINSDIFYTNRSNLVIKRFGIRVSLCKIEDTFMKTFDNIKQCCCVYDDVKNLLFLVFVFDCPTAGTYKVLNSDEMLSKGVNLMNLNVPDIERPDVYVEMKALPLNCNGKCDRQELHQLVTQNCKPKFNQKVVSDVFKSIWCNVLKIHKVSNETFVELGGNSVTALQTVTALEEAKIKIPQDFIVLLLKDGNFESCVNSLNAENLQTPKKKIENDEKTKKKAGRPRKKKPRNSVKNKFVPEEDYGKKMKYEVKEEPSAEQHVKELQNDDRVEILRLNITISWKFDLKKCIDASPVLYTYNNTSNVIVGSHSSRLSSVKADNGAENWTTTLGDRIESSCCIDHQRSKCFVGCYDHFLYCISLLDGKIIWKFETHDIIKSTPCLSSNQEIVYAASYDTYLYCLTVQDGKLIKKVKLSDSGVFSSGVVSSLINAFYIGTLDGSCVSLNQSDNEVLWKWKLASPVFASPCVLYKDGVTVVVFAEVVGRLHFFNGIKGSKLWTYDCKGNIYSSPRSLIIGNSNLLVFGCYDYHLYCLELNEDVKLKWREKLGASIFSGTSVFHIKNDTLIAAATTKGSVFLCDFYTGTIKRIVKLNGEIFSSFCYDNNHLYVGCRDNYLYCLNVTKLHVY